MKNNHRMKRVAGLTLLAAFGFAAVSASQALAWECDDPKGTYAYYGFTNVGHYWTQAVSCPAIGSISGYIRAWNNPDFGKALQAEWYEGTTCSGSPNNCMIRAEGYTSAGVQKCAVGVSSAGTTSFNLCPSTTHKWKAFLGSVLQ